MKQILVALRKSFMVALALLVMMQLNLTTVMAAEQKNGPVLEADGLYHYYVDGVKTTQTGLVFFDNVWIYLENGIWNPNKLAIVSYDGGVFMIANGTLVQQSGLVECNGIWYYLSNGQVQNQHTGFASYNGEWFYIAGGVLATNVSGVLDYAGSKFLVADGRILYSYSGLFQNPTDGVWYYIAAGQVQTQYTGLVQYDGAWFYCINGVLNTAYSNCVVYDGAVFQIKNGTMIAQGHTVAIGKCTSCGSFVGDETAVNVGTLIEYIEADGISDSTGDIWILNEEADSETTIITTITYRKGMNVLSFAMDLLSDSDISACITFDYKLNSIPDRNSTVSFVLDGGDNGYFYGSAAFDMTTYNYNTMLNFTGTNFNSQDDYESYQTVCNLMTMIAMVYWDDLIINTTGLGLDDIGFTSLY